MYNKLKKLVESEKGSIEEKVIIADIMNTEEFKRKFETSNENQMKLAKAWLGNRRFLLGMFDYGIGSSESVFDEWLTRGNVQSLIDKVEDMNSKGIVDFEEYERMINCTMDTIPPDEISDQPDDTIDCSISIVDFDGDRLVLEDSIASRILNKIKTLFGWRKNEL